MYKGIVTDLDGTLLGKDHKVSEYTKKIVNEVIEKGIKFYIATGRNYSQAKGVMDQLEVKIPMITSNGARINDENGKLIYENPIDKEIIEKILNINYEKYGENIICNTYIGEDWIVPKGVVEKIKKDVKKYSWDLPLEEDLEKLKNEKILKFFYFGKYEELLELEKEILEKTNGNVASVFVSNRCLEIFNITSNKANAAKFLLKRENIKLEETVAFGDGENDFELITEVGQGFAMGNAIDRLKSKLPENFPVVENNSEDGEAKKLKELFL